ncbi:MAG: hypothetical protein GX556_19860, partial [Fibrobacter sp.]|nr:hypothetical protein [Fibrobacter sp.]
MGVQLVHITRADSAEKLNVACNRYFHSSGYFPRRLWVILCIVFSFAFPVRVFAADYTDYHGDGSLAGWTKQGARNWSESDGYALPAHESNDQGFLINDYNCGSNGTFTAIIVTESDWGSNCGGIVFRFTNTSSYYYLYIGQANPSGTDANNAVKVNSNSTDYNASPVWSVGNLNFTGFNLSYQIKVVMSGSDFTVYLNNVQIGTFNDATHGSGKVGYGYSSQWNRKIKFDASSWADYSSTNYTWDTSDDAGFQSGSGTWGGASNEYWSTDGNTRIAWPGAGNTATFTSGGTSAITVDGTQDVDSMAFLSNGYTLSSGTINLGTKNGIYVYTDKEATINSVISGSAGIKVYGGGQLILGGNNTFTGASTVYSGKPKLIHANSLGSTSDATTINNGACIQLDGETTFAAEQLYINGAGFGSFPGVVRTDGADDDDVVWPGKITMQSASTIAATGAADIMEISGVIEGAYQLTSTGSGTIILSGTNTYSGGTTISSGTLQIGNAGTAGSITGNVTNNGTLAFNRTNAYTFAGVISGSGAVIQSGTDTLILSGTNTFTGGLTIANGIIKAGNTQALGDFGNSITVSSGAALDVNQYNLQGYTQNIVINGQRDASTGAIINTNSAEQLNAIRQISLGADASIGNNGGRFDLGRNIVGSTCITGNNHVLTKVGTNFISILGNATDLAGLVVNGGRLCLEANSAAGTAPITVNSGAVLESWGTRTITNNISINDGGQLRSSDNSGHTTVHNGTFTLTGSTTFNTPAANTTTIGGAIGGTGSLTKTGSSGTLVLSNTNTYTGATTVSYGTLMITGATNSSSAVSVAIGANLGGTGTVAGTVNVAAGGIITPGNGGAGTLKTGALILNNTSVLNYELGTARDSIKVTGNLTLDGTLNITALSGFGAGSYTLMTCTGGSITNNTMVTGTVPSGYDYSISVVGSSVILTVTTSAADNLILYYMFNETATGGTNPVTVYDSSGNGKNGTAYWFPPFKKGIRGNAIVLDGKNDTVVAPTGIVSGCSDITICTWVRLDTLRNWARIFDFGSGTDKYMFLAPTGGSLRFAIKNGGGEQTVNATMFPVKVWKHVTARLSGDSGQIYLDGVLAATSTTMSLNPSDLGSTTKNYIGESQWPADTVFKGALDDFRVYCNALTPARIAAIYDSTKPVNFTWDNDTGAGYQAASGTWGTNNYWSPDSGYALMPWGGAGSSATFAGGSDGTWTINVNGTQNVDSLTFSKGTYTITGGTALNFGTKPGILVASGKNAVINTVISGTPGISKYGPGTLTLGGANTYSGPTVINAGTISIGAINNGGEAGRLGLSPAAADNLVFLGGTLTYTGSGHSSNRLFTLGTGGGTINASGSGALSLSGSGSVAFNGTGTRTLTLGGTNTGNNVLATAINNDASSNATSITKTGAGKWILIGDNGATGTVTISGGTLQIGNDGPSGSISGNVTNGGVLIFNRPDDYTYSGVISSTGSLTQAGSGTLTLSGVNTYTGATTVSDGTLAINGSTHSSSAVSVAAGATLAGTGTAAGNVTIANSGIIAPGNSAGTLHTGNLVLNNSSVLDFELGTSSDRIEVTGNLTLDGILNVTETAGFGPRDYTIITYTGSLSADNGLEIGTAPEGYDYIIKVNTVTKLVILSVVSPVYLNPVTVVESAPVCSVYTDDWTIVFDNGAGGGITAMTDSVHGQSSSGQGNQIGAGQNLYYFSYGG